ncbi:MAG: hypothetical protein J7L83_04345 [Thaumarchaeota archaeon]|nr:hypothetical protein [Nitrososphaerota archaeon]
MKAKLVFSDARLLRELVDALAAVLDSEATFKIADDGIMASGMDYAHIAYVSLKVEDEVFEEWDVEPSLVTLSLADIQRTVRPRKNELAILEIDEDKVKIVLADRAGSSARIFTFKTLENIGGGPDAPKLGFTAAATVDADVFAEAVGMLAKIDSQIRVALNEALELRARNELVEAVEKYDPNGMLIHDLRVDVPAEAVFSAAYLERIAKAARKLSNDVEIELASDKPIKISPLFPGGELTYFVAPIIGEAGP